MLHRNQIRIADFKILNRLRKRNDFNFLESENILSWFMDSHFIIMVQQKMVFKCEAEILIILDDFSM